MSRYLKQIAVGSFLSLFLLSLGTPLYAEESNNKFGIHLAVPAIEQIEKSAELVNTNGDWGYVTLIIQENDRNHEKWQDIFNKLREVHLIPIIRIATRNVGSSWRKPAKEDAQQWVEFLDGLNWVVKERYIILFNETNHGLEWGGSVDPVDFANVSKEFASKLRAKNPDFFVMLGGLDASAPAASPLYADEAQYLKTVVDTIGKDDFNTLFSGLSSHSYPNPGFVGSPYGSGRGTVRTYDWELQLLQSWGVKQLPVFITETGWEGNALPRSTIAANFQEAFNNVWLPDDRVKAVTPFVLDYQGPPFLGFSWRQFNQDQYYPQFYTVQSMQKTNGKPDIDEKGGFNFSLPTEFVVNSNYHEVISLRNDGEGIWDQKNGYKLQLENFDTGYYFPAIYDIKPFETQEVELFFNSGSKTGPKKVKISLLRDNKTVLQSKIWQFEVAPLPSTEFKVSLYPKLQHKGSDFEIQIFNAKEELVYKKKNVEVEHTQGTIKEVKNIVFGKKYRVVILKPYYLPRQAFITFRKDKNEVVFERMFPLDFNRDGKFDLGDLWELITHPSLLSFLLP